MDGDIQNRVQSLRNPEASDGEKKEAAKILANLATNNDYNKAAIAAAGGIPPLVATGHKWQRFCEGKGCIRFGTLDGE